MTRIKNKVILFSKKRERLGSELLLNGGFDTDSGWTITSSSWSIANGIATGLGVVGGQLYQTERVFALKKYVVTFEITAYTSGTVQAKVGNLVFGTARSAIGVYTEVLTRDSDNINNSFHLRANPSIGFVGSIDNVSVREVL